MKNALILHGTMGSPRGNWFQWLKRQLQNKGYKVWVPRLPVPQKPRVSRNIKYIFERNWKFDKDSIIISHSSGPATALAILNELPAGIQIRKCIFVSAFLQNEWEANSELFDYKYDFAKIKRSCSEFVQIHSDNDPYVPLNVAQNVAKKLDIKLHIRKGEKHFNLEGGPQYRKLPFIMEYL